MHTLWGGNHPSCPSSNTSTTPTPGTHTTPTPDDAHTAPTPASQLNTHLIIKFKLHLIIP